MDSTYDLDLRSRTIYGRRLDYLNGVNVDGPMNEEVLYGRYKPLLSSKK